MSQSQQTTEQPRHRKTSKRACDSCNVRKIFCDGCQPCESCVRARINCTFLKKHSRPGPRKPRVKTFQLINSSQHDWKLGQGKNRKRRRSGSSDDETASPGEPAAKTRASALISSTSAPADTQKKCRIPLNVLLHYIEIYLQRLSPVWPVLSCDDLKDRLQNDTDLEAYVLAAAVSAAVMSQLRLECVFNLENASEPLNSVALANESLRLRSLYAYREKFTKEAIMTSFFLHVYYVNRHGKSKSGLIFLREAISFAQAMRLDRESTYTDLKVEEGEAKRKLYWLLFITDISYAIQHGFPATLNMEINYPAVTEENESFLCGFMNLISLYSRLCNYRSVIDSWVDQEKTLCSEESLRSLQSELSENFPYKLPTNETQKADILATRSWLRLVAWNVSMRHGFLSSDSNDATMALNYPAIIAEDLLVAFATLPRSAIEAHGNVMELKLFEITNSLGDLLIHAPLLFDTTTWKTGPREYFLQLLDHMIQFRNINRSILSIILEKGEKIGVPLPPRRLSIDDSDDNKSEFRFVHELTEEATRDYRRTRGSRASIGGRRQSKTIHEDSIELSDRTPDSYTSERPVLGNLKTSTHVFDEGYSMVPTTSAGCSPLRNQNVANEYFDPFSATPNHGPAKMG